MRNSARVGAHGAMKEINAVGGSRQPQLSTSSPKTKRSVFNKRFATMDPLHVCAASFIDQPVEARSNQRW